MCMQKYLVHKCTVLTHTNAFLKSCFKSILEREALKHIRMVFQHIVHLDVHIDLMCFI